MQLDSTTRQRRRLIGLTPLIDVVFILLLFFMLASQFHQWRAMTVTTVGVPSQSATPPVLLVRLHDDGGLDLNGDPIEIHALTTRLRQALKGDPELSVQVASDDEVPLQALVTLLDLLHAAGIDHMTLR